VTDDRTVIDAKSLWENTSFSILVNTEQHTEQWTME
jgi:hypothetical protein